jgi:phosphomannomutase
MQNKLPKEVERRIKQWEAPPFDEKTRQEIECLLKTDPQSLLDLFYTTISFGTGGMRGVMGPGTNRINIYTIRSATQGLANYILQKNLASPRAFIGYDSRQNSRLFAEETARVLAANGIETYLTKELCPTPFVSFGCRHLQCTAAVMITASHNPKEYNGYKVYWSDGGQVVAPHDEGIIREVNKIQDPNGVKLGNLDHPLIHPVPEEVKKAYLETLDLLQNHREDRKSLRSQLGLVYSSLHGTGITLVPEALKRWGFTNLSLVEEQIIPDGTFPSAPSPNPEEIQALKLGIEQLIREKQDLFLATDPDADRLGVVVNHRGKAQILNGNQVAALCTFYLCQTLSHQGKLKGNEAIVTTIVTTDLLTAIANHFHLKCFKVLTGFKYIGEKIHEWEERGNPLTFLFGAEESLGYLYGTHSRDKDAIITSCLLSEIAFEQKRQGKTLVDLLYEIYKQFGVFREKQLSQVFGNSQKGSEKMDKMMHELRASPPKTLCGQEVIRLDDYAMKRQIDFPSQKQTPLTLPKSNVLALTLKDQSQFIIRPSGTEPKIKIYGMVREPIDEEIDQSIKRCDDRLDQMLNKLKEILNPTNLLP